jgi:hypothetical protein
MNESEEAAVSLVDEGGVRAWVRQRTDNGDWWLFVNPNLDLACAIEKRFYAGGKNAHFETLVGPLTPGGLVSIFAARKAEMSAAQLGALMREYGRGSTDLEEQLLTQDIVFMHENIKVAEASAIWFAWFMGELDGGRFSERP